MNADRLTDYALWGMTAQGDSFEFMADIRVDEIEERVSIPNVFVAFCYILKLIRIIKQCYGRTTITLFLGPPPFPIVPIFGRNCCYNVAMLEIFCHLYKYYCCVASFGRPRWSVANLQKTDT